ncbi:MAG: zinc ribbon domain-containing protein [Anaerolineaceae bacterium]
MANQFQYGSQRLNIRRPPVLYAGLTVAGGFLLLLLVIISSFINYGHVRPVVEQMYPLQVFYLIFLAIMTISLFIIALVRIGTGIRELVAPVMAANIPRDFGNKVDVYNAFTNRVISTYQFNTAGGMRAMYGPNTLFMSPVERSVVQKSTRGIGGHITGLVFGIIFAIGVIVANANLDVQLPIVPFIFYIALMVVLIVLDYATGFMVVPHQQPNTVCAEGTEYYRGFGHPAQLITRIPDLALPLRWQGFINRSDHDMREEASASVGNVGQFKGFAFVEQQPQPISSGSQVGGYVLAVSGWFFYLIGVTIFLFFMLPGDVWFTGSGIAPAYLVRFFAMFLLATAASNSGDRLIKSAEALFKSARFRSTAILMDIVGTLSRAEVRVGKGMQDAVEASSIAVRSDFTTRFFAAEIISEVPTLDGPRSLLALNHTSEAEQWIGFFREEINKLREERVRPVGVDLQSNEAQELFQANVALSGARAGAMHQAELAAAQQAAQGFLSPGVGVPAGKPCPYCGQQIPAQAKFCRYCGAKL